MLVIHSRVVCKVIHVMKTIKTIIICVFAVGTQGHHAGRATGRRLPHAHIAVQSRVAGALFTSAVDEVEYPGLFLLLDGPMIATSETAQAPFSPQPPPPRLLRWRKWCGKWRFRVVEVPFVIALVRGIVNGDVIRVIRLLFVVGSFSIGIEERGRQS